MPVFGGTAFAQVAEDDVFSCIRNAETMDDMLHCGDVHIEYWKSVMQDHYQQLHGLLNESRRTMLETSHEAWNDYRRQQVSLSNTIHFGSGDDMNRVFAKVREANLFRHRAEALRELIEIER